MKKTISLFLALVLLMSVFSLVFADEIGEQYYTVKVEYSDNVGKKEQLNLMVQGCKNACGEIRLYLWRKWELCSYFQ